MNVQLYELGGGSHINMAGGDEGCFRRQACEVKKTLKEMKSRVNYKMKVILLEDVKSVGKKEILLRQ